MTARFDKHEDFWLEDGNLILMVDGVYFNVHRGLLRRQCGVFQDMLELPSGPQSGNAEGSSIERPVHVPGISFSDFEAILEHIYYRGPSDLSTQSVADLRRVLQVAQRLQANGIAAHIGIHLMKILPPLARLSLFSEIDVDAIKDSLASSREEQIARKSRSLQRVARRQQQAESEQATTEPPSGAISIESWFITAFKDLVLDFNVKEPFVDENWPLAESIRWHLVIARRDILEARRLKGNAFIVRWDKHHFSPVEAFAVNNVKHMKRSDMLHTLKTAPVSNGELTSLTPEQLIDDLVPSDEEERATIELYCVSVGLA